MFLAHAFDDPVRVENSLLMLKALKQAKELSDYIKDEYGIEPPETYDDIIAACETIQADQPDLGCWDC